MVRARGLLLALAAFELLAAPIAVGAQGMDCQSLPGTGGMQSMPGVVYMQTPRLRCPDGLRLRADSAVFFDQARVYQLFGNVLIETDSVHLESKDAQYYANEKKIDAQGSVVLRLKQDGTEISGGESLTYYQAGGVMLEDQLIVTGGRPRAVLQPRRAEGTPPDSAADPYEITANERIVIKGQNDFEAYGNVTILRGDLNAGGDQVMYFAQSGQLRLSDSAYVDAEKYDMRGAVVVITMVDDDVTDVSASGDAQLVGEKLDIRAPQIQLYLSDGALDRLLAGSQPEPAADPRGPTAPGVPAPPGAPPAAPRQAIAEAESFTISGNTLEIDVEGELLQNVVATGRARAVSSAGDSLNTPGVPEIARKDWVEGERVEAVFTSEAEQAPPPIDSAAAPPDTTAADEQPGLELLMASGNARALYRMPAADSTVAADPACAGQKPFALHYVVGDTLVITLDDGTIKGMEVTGKVLGEHFEPTAASCRAGWGAAPAGGSPPATTTPPSTTPPPPAPGRPPLRSLTPFHPWGSR